ncbi:Efflux transporter, RND family, MFP subunit [Candidatus Sulfotelmatobacter sp. SbA7]|jgi:RND family efflux transporter MFP subunit|nr:Efflux transporter, RND family, MFP subunit [Candidatus Sulfotelmatobacter sp. SbA7]
MKVEQENDIEQPVASQSRPSGRPSRHWWVAVLAFAAVVALVVSGILPRIQARNTLAKETKEMAIPTVAVVHPQRSAPSNEIVLPANVQAYIDSPIYARTNGYLKQWYADIGARVAAGQLLAEIETPEVDQQLRQARADLGTAEANLHLAEITSNRYAGLLKTDSVSKQDADNAEGAYAAQKATVQAMEANVKRLEQLQSFEKIYAPFAGVITARRTDIGALIDSGGSGGTRTELFHIAQPDRLRVYVNVPEAYSQAAKPGLTADLVLSEFPGRRFEGKLVRTANAIDQTTRTLLVEIAVNNPTGTLLSGAYAEVHLKLPGATSTFTLPVTTLLFRSEGLRVATVIDGQHAELKPITVGRDYGSEIEVVAGLTGDEAVIANPPDSIVSGEEVRVAQPSSGTPASGGAKP